MTRVQFKGIVLEMSDNIESDSPSIEVRLINGMIYRGTWWEPTVKDTIAMDLDDEEPPIFIDCASIVSVQLIS